MNIFAIVKLVLIAAVLVCGLIGAFGAVFKDKASGNTHFYLYKSVTNGQTTYFKDVNPSCKDTLNVINAAFAFAILGWITALAGTAIAALSLVKPSMLPAIVGVIVSAVCMLFLTIAWALVAASYHQEICKDRLVDSYKYDYAFAFQLIAWILSIGWVAFEVLGMMGLIPGAAAPVSEANSG